VRRLDILFESLKYNISRVWHAILLSAPIENENEDPVKNIESEMKPDTANLITPEQETTLRGKFEKEMVKEGGISDEWPSAKYLITSFTPQVVSMLKGADLSNSPQVSRTQLFYGEYQVR